MLSRIFKFNHLLPEPAGGIQATSPLSFSESALDKLHRDLVYMTSELKAQAQISQRLAAFRQPERSCTFRQLLNMQMDLRGNLHLGMPLGIQYPRRNQVRPHKY